MDENRKNGNTAEEYESNAARKLKALEKNNEKKEEEEPLEINRLSNFWHYNKVKILIAAAFILIFGIGLIQLINRQNPDISILYAGPDYLRPNDCEAFCKTLESITDDYNGDGKKYVQVEDLVFMSDGQIETYLAAAQADDESAVVDKLTNKETKDRFFNEVFAGDAMIMILSEDQYNEIAESKAFVPLSELFDSIPAGAIDEYGIRFCETKFAKFYSSAHLFPNDAVIALRTIPTASFFTGKERAEKRHVWHEDAFKKIINFDYPEGYTPEE